jgi:hypothetical protein
MFPGACDDESSQARVAPQLSDGRGEIAHQRAVEAVGLVSVVERDPGDMPFAATVFLTPDGEVRRWFVLTSRRDRCREAAQGGGVTDI